MSRRAIAFSIPCIICLAFIPLAHSEELLLKCTFHSLLKPSAPEIEVAANIDIDKRTATWGDGNQAQSVKITANRIELEFPPFDISRPSFCSEKLYVKKSVSINRIDGQVWQHLFADSPSVQCGIELAKFGISDHWESESFTGRCVKKTKRDF